VITRRLRLLTWAGIVLMLLHGFEEWLSGFFSVDPSFEFVARLVSSRQEALFVAFQATWWLLLLIFGILTFSAKWRLRALGLFGAVMVFEWMHVGSSILSARYFPGAVTGLLFIPLGITFWIEYLRAWRCAAVCPVCSNPVGADHPEVELPARRVRVCSEMCRLRLDQRIA
jgi:uncharacterized protein with HXXEE motif